MRKFILIISFLLMYSNSWANTISLETISPDTTSVTFNSNFTTIATTMNGSIEGSADGGSTNANLATDTVYEINMADDANPRVFGNEALQIGADTLSGSDLTQQSFVFSGCTPADDSDLSSDISACIAYVNGYRVSKAATSQTYVGSRDTYVDLSQTGVYTATAVTNGAAAPAVAANSARIAKVVTDVTEITSITDLANRRLASLVIPTNYRSGAIVSKDSTATVTILPGTIEINNSMIENGSTTTLNLATAGDWAGGSSLRAVNTFGFVGVDSSGNLKLHTTAPTHSNYAVSTTVGKKRYATWSGTVYRIIGWFYMDAASSGLIERASNIKEGDVANTIMTQDLAVLAFSSTTPSEVAKIHFYNSGGDVLLMGVMSADVTATDTFQMNFERDSVMIIGSGASSFINGVGQNTSVAANYLDTNLNQSGRTYGILASTQANTQNVRRRSLILQEQ